MPPEAEPVPLESGIILAFDTSAAHCAAAVLSGDRVITRVEPMAKGQAERLVPMLDEVLAEAGVTWGDLAAIGVGTGPGNFTGIRIAVALARGLALGLGVPAVGVTGFEAVAEAKRLVPPFTVAIAAPRGQAYVADVPGAARIVDDPPAEAHWLGDVAVQRLVEAIARVARGRPGRERPKPFYLRGADAAPASDPPPVILP